MLILTTAVSGSGESEHLARFLTYATKRKKSVRIFNAADLYLAHAEKIGVRMVKELMLNTRPSTMCAVQSGAMESFCSDVVNRPKDEINILNVHASFHRKGVPEEGFNSYYLNKLKPDVFINFLSDSEVVAEKLLYRRQYRYLFNSDDPNNKINTLKKIMLWQGDEVKDTRSWARRDQKKFFVIPTSAPESILYRLIFEPWRKNFYFGMPITFFHDEKYAASRQRVDNLVLWAERLIICSDPRHMEPLSLALLSKIDVEIFHNVVERDLRWLIPQCDGIVAFFPEIVPSVGVDNETPEVYTTNGESFVIYPWDKKPAGPFLVEWTDENIFQNEEEFKPRFLEYLGKDYLAKVEESEKCYNGGDNG